MLRDTRTTAVVRPRVTTKPGGGGVKSHLGENVVFLGAGQVVQVGVRVRGEVKGRIPHPPSNKDLKVQRLGFLELAHAEA